MTMSETVSYDPPIEEHPDYSPDTPELEVGKAVEVLAYSGVRVIRNDDGDPIGNERYLSDDALEKYGRPYTNNNYIVREIDGFRVKVTHGLNGDGKWIPRDRIVGVDLRKTADLERRARNARRRQRLREERESQDLDVLMEEVVIPHARKKANEVWPGGTVDVDEIDWFWNPQLTNAAGKAYFGTAVPTRYASGRLAVGLAPAYYYQHGIDELLKVVRHELIHVWEAEHPNATKGMSHSRQFKQWIDDMDTHRHCKFWSK